MTKREIIGSSLGLIVTIGVTVLVMSLLFPPGHPNFAAMVGAIVTVFVLIEVARNFGFTAGVEVIAHDLATPGRLSAIGGWIKP